MYGKILITLDGSALAEQSLPHALALAPRFGSRVTLLQVITLSNIGSVTMDTQVPLDFPALERHLREEALRYLEEKAVPLRAAGVEVACEVRRGAVAPVVLEAAEKEGFELIITTSHGRGGLGRFIHGSVADRLVHHAPCPVLLVRSGPTS